MNLKPNQTPRDRIGKNNPMYGRHQNNYMKLNEFKDILK